MARIVCIGEAMIELSRLKDGGWSLGYGGDTMNTAIHLARAGHDVGYFTAMGTDPFSSDLIDVTWPGEGIDTRLILRDPARNAGLYAIRTDDEGERSFTYWRENSAARGMFALPGVHAALVEAEKADLIVYSLITLAILPRDARETLFDFCRRVRMRGGNVAFDGNYRPRLWASSLEAQIARDEAISCADIGLPTLEDETLLSGEATAGAVADHWVGLGCAETIVKLGSKGCRLPDNAILAPPVVLKPIDTSGAGDAFNGGYLAARMNGASCAAAAITGHKLAGWCVMRSGAIPTRDDAGPYR
jgi:2-dehydro-3-deoxygluconokinase